MNGVPCITFDSENYESKDELFQTVATMMRILTDNGYVCSFVYEDCGIYALRFDYQDPEISQFDLRWVKEEVEDERSD